MKTIICRNGDVTVSNLALCFFVVLLFRVILLCNSNSIFNSVFVRILRCGIRSGIVLLSIRIHGNLNLKLRLVASFICNNQLTRPLVIFWHIKIRTISSAFNMNSCRLFRRIPVLIVNSDFSVMTWECFYRCTFDLCTVIVSVDFNVERLTIMYFKLVVHLVIVMFHLICSRFLNNRRNIVLNGNFCIYFLSGTVWERYENFSVLLASLIPIWLRSPRILSVLRQFLHCFCINAALRIWMLGAVAHLVSHRIVFNFTIFFGLRLNNKLYSHFCSVARRIHCLDGTRILSRLSVERSSAIKWQSLRIFICASSCKFTSFISWNSWVQRQSCNVATVVGCSNLNIVLIAAVSSDSEYWWVFFTLWISSINGVVCTTIAHFPNRNFRTFGILNSYLNVNSFNLWVIFVVSRNSYNNFSRLFFVNSGSVWLTILCPSKRSPFWQFICTSNSVLRVFII